MTVRPSARSTAYVMAGILAAEGLLHSRVTAQEISDTIDRLRRRRSLWIPRLYPDDDAASLGLSHAGEPLARWTEPDTALAASLGGLIRQAVGDANLEVGGHWSQPSVRLEVATLDEHRHVHGQRLGPLPVVAHVVRSPAGFAWRWPIRVRFVGSLVPSAFVGPHLDRIYHLVEPGGGYVEIAVVDASEPDALEAVDAAVAVVVGSDADDPGQLLDRALSSGCAAVALVPEPPARLVNKLAVELSHDQPLDVALALVAPAAVLVSSPDLLPRTSVRTWAHHVAEALGSEHGAEAERLREVVRHYRFDREWNGGSEVAAVADRLPDEALEQVTVFRAAGSAAAPHELDDEDAEVLGGDDIGLEEDLVVERGLELGAEQPAPVTEPPPRYLQTEVRDATGATRVDGFVAGQRHQMAVRIAAEASPTAVRADRAFTSPVSDRPLDLTIMANVRGTKSRPIRRTLRLPPKADSAWTKPIPIDVPPTNDELAVELVVFHKGRALQTAVLTGPVLAPGTSPGAPAMALHVDADTPTEGDLDERAESEATLLLTATSGGEPALLDLSAVGRTLPFDRLDQATKAVRRILLNAFADASRPTDLKGAAPVLTKLAVRGATLRNQLKGNNDSFHDDAPWIHVVMFGVADLPLELIYTHPMPDDDDEVPVCDAAIGGAGECTATCPDRTRSDVVCPFGFWGTSKVVERRAHVDDRVGVAAPARRKVAVTSAAVVGTSNKTDIDDQRASTRIVDAVKAAVTEPRFRRVMAWKELREAVSAAMPGVLVLVTHTVKPAGEGNDLGISLELGGDVRAAHRIDQAFVNPGGHQPGPVVLSLGCDTGDLDIGFSDWVGTLHAARAEVVVSTISPVPGKEVADFIERLFTALPKVLKGKGPHRCGALLTEVRKSIVAKGDVLALALTASGDGDVELVGAEQIEGDGG